MFVLILLVVVDSIQSASATVRMMMFSVRATRNGDFATPRFYKKRRRTRPASISNDTIQMDHNPVILFTID